MSQLKSIAIKSTAKSDMQTWRALKLLSPKALPATSGAHKPIAR
jgi:hypothetical protein